MSYDKYVTKIVLHIAGKNENTLFVVKTLFEKIIQHFNSCALDWQIFELYIRTI